MKLKNMKKLGAVVLSYALSLAPVNIAFAIQTDGQVDAGNYGIQRSGNKEWRVGPQVGANATPAADGAGSLGVYNVAGSSYAVVFSSGSEAYFYGPVGLPILASAQTQNTTLGQGIPRRVGLLIYNTTLSVVCVSTATTQGSYRMTISTGGAAATQSSGQCF